MNVLLQTRCVLLTTESRHHRYFAGRITARAGMTVALEEPKPGRGAHSLFEQMQDRFEEESFGGGAERFAGLSQVRSFRSCNQPDCLEWVRRAEPDLVITFGTGKIAPEVYRQARLSVNIHRGILPNYRGLDSDLWAAYRRDFGNIGATVHRLEERLDTGPVLAQRRLRLRPGMEAHHLRYHTTLLAAEMMERLLDELAQDKLPAAAPQELSRGEYLSAIPPLKRWLAGRRLRQHLREASHEL